MITYQSSANPGLMHVASQAQNMAKNARQEQMALAFQYVAMTSMAIMGVTAAAQLIRETLRSDRGKNRC